MSTSTSTTSTSTTSTVVLQTGKMRATHMPSGVDSFSDTTIPWYSIAHRFLPTHLESKYEAIDFATKLGLGKDFSIYDDETHQVSVTPNGNTTLLGNIDTVCSVGSSSTQAFVLTPTGPVPILPVTDEVKANAAILGKDDPLLSEDSMSNFGAKSTDTEKTKAVVTYLKANTPGNIIFVNALGYSVLGFNPRDGSPTPVPTSEQKVVKLGQNFTWTTNKGKTGLITLLEMYASDNMYVVARQVKVGEEELSGQWANQAYAMMKDEPSLKLANVADSVTRVVDLGGSSGTIYEKDDGTFKKTRKIMKGRSPNKIFEEASRDTLKTVFALMMAEL